MRLQAVLDLEPSLAVLLLHVMLCMPNPLGRDDSLGRFTVPPGCEARVALEIAQLIVWRVLTRWRTNQAAMLDNA